jgi:putative hydrolase of the HAD superfamily
VTGGDIPGSAISTIIEFGKDLLDHPVELLDGVAQALDDLRARGLHLLLITKGDLWHQESKVAASGIADRFDAVEIVAEKDVATYRAILERLAIAPEQFCMVGNSVRSDVLPVLELGGQAVHIPYHHLWAHEAVADVGEDHLVVEALHDLAVLFD